MSELGRAWDIDDKIKGLPFNEQVKHVAKELATGDRQIVAENYYPTGSNMTASGVKISFMKVRDARFFRSQGAAWAMEVKDVPSYMDAHNCHNQEAVQAVLDQIALSNG